MSKPDDEQLHVLPMYILDNTDEHGSVEGQMKKVQSGALEILHKYHAQARMRASPLKKPRRGSKKDKNSPAKGGNMPVPSSPIMPGTPGKEKDMSFLHSQDSNHSLPDTSDVQTTEKSMDASNSSFGDRENSCASEDFSMNNFGPSQVYEKVWEYFYTNGSFPPPAYVERWAAAQKQAMMNQQHNDGGSGGGGKQGSNNSNPHQPSHTSSQAAELTQNHPSPNPLHRNNAHPHIKTEAANLDVDPELVHLNNKSGGRVSGGNTPSRPQSVNGTRYPSPLDLLTEAAAAMEAGVLSPSGRPSYVSHSRPPSVGGEFNPSHDPMSPSLPRPHSSPGVHNVGQSQSHPSSPFPKPNCDGASMAPFSCNETRTQSSPSQPSKPVMDPDGCFVSPTLGQGPNEPTFTMMDPTVVRCEWQDNEQCFHDPGIGGMAIGLCHGAVLFEVAKRELHATTALKNPNRYQPTRISLVFYQHKNLNYHHHGYYEYERKLAEQRRKRIDKLMEEGASMEEAEKAVKPGRKRKKDNNEEEEEEKIDFAKTSAAQYKYMWDTTVRHGISLTTDSIITRWIDPQPMVTGPYQRWV
jgi:methylcytosine dioxygenase